MLPPLYKFRAVNEYTLDSLREKYVYFSNPTTFNDPFEFRAYLDHAKNPERLREEFEIQAALKQPNMSESERKRQVAAMIADGRISNSLSALPHFSEDLVRDTPVYCVSENRESILQWSHYADNHRGICIELNFNMDATLKNASKVEYSDEYPVVELFEDDTSTRTKKLMLTKSTEWQYESEYRVINPLRANNLRHDVDGSVFVSITFGAKISEELREQIIDATRENLPHVTFMQARLAEKTFSLEFEPYVVSQNS